MSKKRKKVQTHDEETFDLPSELDTNGCLRLVEAIVKQARADVVNAKPGSVVRRDAENFFRSEYFTGLTGFDGKPLLKALQDEYEEKQAKKRGGKQHDDQ